VEARLLDAEQGVDIPQFADDDDDDNLDIKCPITCTQRTHSLYSRNEAP
jgi:hypothetical protein